MCLFHTEVADSVDHLSVLDEPEAEPNVSVFLSQQRTWHRKRITLINASVKIS